MLSLKAKARKSVYFGYSEAIIPFTKSIIPLTNKKVYIPELGFHHSVCMAAICYTYPFGTIFSKSIPLFRVIMHVKFHGNIKRKKFSTQALGSHRLVCMAASSS